LVETEGLTVEQVATEIGKAHDPTYVYQRLRLMKLSPKWRKELEAGRISTGVALQVGRVPEETQGALAAQYLRKGMEDDTLTVRDVRDWIRGNAMLALSDAPWDLADAALPGGACSLCPKRTGAAIELFPDLAKGKEKAGDLCLDVVCWKKKEETFIALQRKQNPDLVELKGWEEGHKWQAKKGGTKKGIIVQEGYAQDSAVRGTVLEIEVVKTREGATEGSGAAKGDAKKLRQAAEVRRRVIGAVARGVLVRDPVMSEWEFAVSQLVGRVMNDDRRMLCKALEIEAKKAAYGGLDFEGALVRWFKDNHPLNYRAFLVLAVACVGSVRHAGKTDPVAAMAVRLKIDLDAIARDVKAGKKAVAEKTTGKATAVKGVKGAKSVKGVKRRRVAKVN
jgi:hypothetical protein